MIALGSRYRRKQRVVIGFEPDTFAAIRDRAARNHTSFAEEVRTLTEWGLEQCA